MRRLRGFTLLEVMVAMAIMAVGFGVLSEAYGRAALATIDARNVTIGTILARGKMLDVEFEMKKDGFGDYDKVIEGDFTKEGQPEFKWIATARKIEIPVGKMGDLANQGGPDLMNMLGGGKTPSSGVAASAAGAGGVGGVPGAGGAQGGLNMGMLTPILQTASDVIKNSVREVTLDVRFPEGGRLTHMTVVTHLVDDVKLATELAKIPGMGNLPNIPGLTPPGGNPGNTGNTGNNPPGTNTNPGLKNPTTPQNPLTPTPMNPGQRGGIK